MTDSGAHSWLVRLSYTVPAHGTHNARTVDEIRQERHEQHPSAHATARRWANNPLPAGATNAVLWIEERGPDGRLVRVEDWELGHTRSTAAEALDRARADLKLVR